MKIRGNKTGAGKWTAAVGLPSIFLLCFCFFLGTFFGSFIFSHQKDLPADLRPRLPETAEEKRIEFEAAYSGGDYVETIPFQFLSWSPRALYFPKFATEEQCESIVKMAKARLEPSTLALRPGETEDDSKGVRTSAFEDKTGILGQIDDKIAKATRIPRTHGEAYNVLRYEIGQRYQSHYDAFNPSEYGPQKSQRVASFLLYLSDVEEGGETMFPYENGKNMDGKYDYIKCIGLKVKPRRGDGLLFYSLLPNGTIDPTSLHGSCPVIKGQKWVATKWIRDQDQN